MRRVVVLGAGGFFGRAAVALLAADGIAAVGASRRTGIDAEDAAGLRAFLRDGDVVLDAAGPFQRRSGTLIDVAIDRHADVVDLSDSAAYARIVLAKREAVAAGGIAVFSGCSAISAVVATLVRATGIAPARVDAWLAPASRDTANVATARALLGSLRTPEWRTCEFAPLRGIGVESAIAVQLPIVWPKLRETGFWVDPHVPGLAPLIDLAARSAIVRATFDRIAPLATRAARLVGRVDGRFAVRVEGDGRVARWLLAAPRDSYLIAVAPAVLAVRDLVAGRTARGVVPADEQVGFEALRGALTRRGIAVERVAEG